MVRIQPDGRDSARPGRLADQPYPATRCALGAIQGILGRPVGPRVRAASRAFEQPGLLGSVDLGRRRRVDGGCLLRGAFAQG